MVENTNRRSFLFGAVAVPAGIALPDSIARELVLPPPELKAGDQLIIRPNEAGRDAVWRLSDIKDMTASITVVDDDGKIVGHLRPSSFEVRIEPIRPHSFEARYDPMGVGSSGLHSSPRYYFDSSVSVEVALVGSMGRL